MWVPAHVGITGNEMADRLAKRALTKDNVEVQVNVSKAEVKCIIWEKINKRWQERWEREEKEGTYTKSREMIKRIGWEGGIGEKRLC